MSEELVVDRQLFLMANTLFQNRNLGRAVQYTTSLKIQRQYSEGSLGLIISLIV